MTADLFSRAARKMKNSPAVISVYVAALAMSAIGLVFFFEDTLSSMQGFEYLENRFNIEFAILGESTYWLASITNQIAFVVLLFFYALRPSKNNLWILALGICFMLVDIATDIQARSGDTFFNGQEFVWNETTVAALGVSALYYTFGSEVFLSIGPALAFVLFAPAVEQFAKTWIDIRIAIQEASKRLTDAFGPIDDNIDIPDGRPVRDPFYINRLNR